MKVHLSIDNVGLPKNPLRYEIAEAKKRVSKRWQEISLKRFSSFSAHTFRHTFATRCIEAGMLPKTVQGYLGHTTLQMTMDLYVHVTEEFKQKELEKLNSIPHKH